ncbi:MAG: glycerophosphodiester phosphodiesterase, partial [Muribaculaceae bacterium]|nr:glycerophosphodiester phosphodiesterase [Muribaculaceae bacterium]
AQNTRTSFIKADSIGVFGSEIDVWLTADDHLIVNHDRKFQGVEMEFDPFETIRSLKLNNGEQIPTLDEYLAVVRKHPKTRLVLEMKSLSDFGREDKAVRMIADKLRQYNIVDKTDIIVFSINAALQFKKIFPAGVKIFYLDGDMAPKKVKKLGLAGIDYSVKVLREHPEWIKEAQKLGLEVNVWTVNTPEDIAFFVEQGVDYITTDNPEEVQNYIKNYKPAKDSKKKKK